MGELAIALDKFLEYIKKFPYGKYTGRVNEIIRKIKQEKELQIISRYDYR